MALQDLWSVAESPEVEAQIQGPECEVIHGRSQRVGSGSAAVTLHVGGSTVNSTL